MKKIAILNSQVEAQTLGQMLADQQIPHLIRSYHDSAYDGLFQKTLGWGHIEAPEESASEIRAMLEHLRAGGPDLPPEH